MQVLTYELTDSPNHIECHTVMHTAMERRLPRLVRLRTAPSLAVRAISHVVHEQENVEHQPDERRQGDDLARLHPKPRPHQLHLGSPTPTNSLLSPSTHTHK